MNNLYSVTWKYRETQDMSLVVVAKDQSEAISIAELGQFDQNINCYYLGVSRPDVAAHVVLRGGCNDCH